MVKWFMHFQLRFHGIGEVPDRGDAGGHVHELAIPPARQPHLVHQRGTGKPVTNGGFS